MDAAEFEREFDLLYNNISSNNAPSIDAYEKSVFLTEAQEELITAIYDGSFENTEKFREYLNNLVVNKSYDSTNDIADLSNYPNCIPVSSNSILFAPPSDMMFITYEALSVDKGKCGNMTVLVKPTTQDEYHRISRNPFRRARNKEALRLNTNGLLEIVYPENSYTYQIRYIKKPNPIILYEIAGLTINGKDGTEPVPIETDPMLHRFILNAAVTKAATIYKQAN